MANEKRTISWGSTQLGEDYRKLWAAIHEAYPNEFYVLDGDLIRCEGREFKPVSIPELRALIDHAIMVKPSWARRGTALPPLHRIAQDAHAIPMGCPEICGVTALPFVRSDGSLHLHRGLDPGTGTFLVEGLDYRHLRATHGDSHDELCALTPPDVFSGPGGMDIALALLLTLMARPGIEGPVPLFLLDGSPEGRVAKTLMAALGYLMCGTDQGILIVPNFPDTAALALADRLLDHPPILLLAGLDSRVLLQGIGLPEVITAPGKVALRKVGKTVKRIRSRTVLLGAASDPDFSDALAPCMIRIPIVEGDGATHLICDVLTRPAIVAQLVKLVRQAIPRGIPEIDRAHIVPGFEEWSRRVGGLLLAIGGDPAALKAHWNPLRPAYRDLVMLCENWPTRVTVKGAEEYRPLSSGAVLNHAREHEAFRLLEMVEKGHGAHGRHSRLGRVLKPLHQNRTSIGGWHIIATQRSGSSRYIPGRGEHPFRGAARKRTRR